MYNLIIKYIVSILIVILLISCSKKSIEDDMTVYSFDGEYNLCLNWYAPRDVFNKNEQDEYFWYYEGACNVPITIENNQFNWIYEGSIKECAIISRQNEYDIFHKQLGVCDHPDGEVFELFYTDDGFSLVKIGGPGIYPNFKVVLSKKSSRSYKKLMTINDYINPYTIFADDNFLDINWPELKFLDQNSTILSVPYNLVITDGLAEAEELGSAFDVGCYAGGIFGWFMGDTIWDSIADTSWCTELGDSLEGVIVDSEVLKDDGSISNNNYCAQYFITKKNNFKLDTAHYICIPFTHPTDQSHEAYLPRNLSNASYLFSVEK